jgi:sulfopyruvate decarboxylase subunit beta
LRKPECIKILDRKLDQNVLVVTPTGKTYMYWEATQREAQISQLNLGLCTPVGLGLALALPHRKVVVLDGDGNLLFNLASLADLAVQNPGNLIDIVFDNECYQSCDSFPSATARGVDLEAIARGCKIKNALTVRNLNDFETTLDKALRGNELFFIVAKVEPGEEVVPLPRQEGRENKYRFVRYVERTENIRIINPYARRRKKDFVP